MKCSGYFAETFILTNATGFKKWGLPGPACHNIPLLNGSIDAWGPGEAGLQALHLLPRRPDPHGHREVRGRPSEIA